VPRVAGLCRPGSVRAEQGRRLSTLVIGDVAAILQLGEVV